MSVRLPDTLGQKVETIAALEGRSIADTVRVLTEEAIKMREFPEVIFVAGPTGRRATFVGGPDVMDTLCLPLDDAS